LPRFRSFQSIGLAFALPNSEKKNRGESEPEIDLLLSDSGMVDSEGQEAALDP
jgi:hypothetical protein